MKNTILEINQEKFLENIRKIKEYTNKEIMPVVKANAYGTYINKRVELLNQFNIIAVAEVQEALEIRKLGYKKEIFILNQPLLEELEEIYQENLTVGISEITFIQNIHLPIKVHLEIETGMNRTGIQFDNLEKTLQEIKKNKNITVEGIYTHFSSADTDLSYTKKQFEIFEKAVGIVKNDFHLKYIHCSASNGMINYPENLSNLVRPGIIMYGYESFEGSRNKIPVEPITVLKTKITYIKKIQDNEAISYNQKYISKTPMTVATIPIGYADGLRRELINKGEVIVKNEKRKILGAICMDSCMIDVTDLDVKVGDYVYLWDNKKITLEEIAKKCNTINYEIISTISSRVKREFI